MYLVFSKVIADARDIVVVVSPSSASFPPGFFGGRLGTYSPLSTLSLLLQMFLMISLSSRPVTKGLLLVIFITSAEFIAFICSNLVMNIFIEVTCTLPYRFLHVMRIWFYFHIKQYKIRFSSCRFKPRVQDSPYVHICPMSSTCALLRTSSLLSRQCQTPLGCFLIRSSLFWACQ